MIGKRVVAAGVAASVGLIGIVLARCSEPAIEARTLEHLSPVYTVDREYRSMRGPQSTQQIAFPEAAGKELLWITGYRAVMVGADGESPMSQEFMCHSNLDFDSKRHARLFNLPLYHGNRLFTLSQGQFDIKFPDGFGLPYFSHEELSLTTQVLNLNPDQEIYDVRHKVTIDYARDRDLRKPMKPLFMTSGWGLVLLEGSEGYFGEASPAEEDHGPGCLPGEAAGHDNYTDAFDRQFSGHWVVQPGREVNRTLVTNILKIPYDTTLHYIAVHLHPFAESLELVDLTTGKSVFLSDVDNSEDKIGLRRVEYFSSEEGIPVFRDHEYELISVYNNTTSTEQDSMAVMLLYLYDKRFEKPQTVPVEIEVTRLERPVPLAEERVVLHTDFGDVTLGLHPTAAPRHVERFLELVRLGVYDTMGFSRIEPGYLVQTGFPQSRSGPPLTPRQQEALEPLDAEFTDLEHRRGVVSMVLNDNRNPHSAEASFFILLRDAGHLDGNYTVIGRVLDGMDALDRMAEVPLDGTRPRDPVIIRTAEVASR